MSDASPVTTPPKVDGRHERSKRTRKAILTALLDLVDEGNLEPTAGEIAARAGIAVRSIRQHFASRVALFLAASEAHATRVAPPSEGIDPSLPLAERIAAFAEVRSRELEATARVRRAAAAHAAPSGPASDGSPIARATDSTWRRRRREVLALFARELAAPHAPKRLADALDLVTHGRTWDVMRESLSLSRAEATALLRTNLTALLAAVAGGPASLPAGSSVGRSRRIPSPGGHT
ncbi:MAG: TetR/AcrR family transcriptional regulator [Polyangiaceae bacterium]